MQENPKLHLEPPLPHPLLGFFWIASNQHLTSASKETYNDSEDNQEVQKHDDDDDYEVQKYDDDDDFEMQQCRRWGRTDTPIILDSTSKSTSEILRIDLFIIIIISSIITIISGIIILIYVVFIKVITW